MALDDLKGNLTRLKMRSSSSSAKKAKGENPLFVLVSIFIGACCVGALWISVLGLLEKKRVIEGLRQIQDIVSISRQMAPSTHRITDGNQEDLLSILNFLGQIKQTTDVDGVQTLKNPWGGVLVAKTAPDRQIRIESTLPATQCRRLVSTFSQEDVAVHTQKIEVRSDQTPWISLYTRTQDRPPSEAAIRINCGLANIMKVAFIFSLN